ncbi:MAG: hypothetical protein P8O04_04750 [Flavobacteriaceae bacterium]|jgi:DNA-binding CsgD family transcriptional regulator|nr:hypothetical protein [Flavobacteriales bacterium]MDG1271749.1 hypothetical protein [Flavobacteriaceae bacterium]
MQKQRFPNQTQIFTEIERLLLRSLALGMGDSCICNLLDASAIELNEVRRQLYAKLEVKNCYAAVSKAFRMGLLASNEYCPESIKTFALTFAHRKIKSQTGSEFEIKKELWDLYDSLVEFESYLYAQHFSEEQLLKKNPTEAGN